MQLIAAKCIIAAGGYEKLYLKHIATPSAEVFESCGKLKIPNYSMRMSNLSAAVLLPQVKVIEERRQLCNRVYNKVFLMSLLLDFCEITLFVMCFLLLLCPCIDDVCYLKMSKRLEEGAAQIGACIEVPPQHPKVDPCNDSIQFNLKGYSFEQVMLYVDDVKARGVPVAIFGAPDNARNYRTWHFLGDLPVLAQTDRVIKFAIDVRLPPAFKDEDFDLMTECLLAGFAATGSPTEVGSTGDIVPTTTLTSNSSTSVKL